MSICTDSVLYEDKKYVYLFEIQCSAVFHSYKNLAIAIIYINNKYGNTCAKFYNKIAFINNISTFILSLFAQK